MGYPTLTFNGTVGQKSISLGGPDAIEGDLLDLSKMFDPTATLRSGVLGGISAANIQDGAVDDDAIGALTPDTTITEAFTGTGVISVVLSYVAKIIKAITGKSTWYTSPVTTIEALNTQVGTNTSDISAQEVALDTHKTAAILDHPSGSVTEIKLASGSVSDVKIGNRSITLNGTTQSSTLTAWLVAVWDKIKLITGETGSMFSSSPNITLAAASTSVSANTLNIAGHIAGTLTRHGSEYITYSGSIADALSVYAALEALYTRVNTIITTPVESVSAAEIIDARDGEATLGDKIDSIDNAIDAMTEDIDAGMFGEFNDETAIDGGAY